MRNYINLLMGIVLFALMQSCSDLRDNELQVEGKAIIQKIEIYKSNHGILPENAKEFGMTMSEEGPLFYEKINENLYIVYYGTSLGETKIYYSDSRKWEDKMRH